MAPLNIDTPTFAFFKAAGVFRKKTVDKAREAFDDALPDFVDGDLPVEYGDAGETLFSALLAFNEAIKAEKIAADVRREEARAAKVAKIAALPIASGFLSLDEKISRLPAGAYVLSSAQNNTTAHVKALAALVSFCEHNGASLLIGRMTYNKNGYQQPGVDEETWYAPEVKPYLVEGQIDLGGYHFLADANVIPTATWPTSGFEGNTPAGIGAIIPASKIELRVSAAGKNAATKVIAATGALTLPNYILRKTGAKAAAAHCIGAVYVNTVTGEIRHLEYMPDSNGIYDTTGFYNGLTVAQLGKGDVAAFQPGDIHAEKMETVNLTNTVDLIQRFQPDNLLLHDLLDFSSRNHHNIKDPFFLRAQHVAGNTVKSDLEAVARVTDDLCYASHAIVHIVESNHDLAVDTWLKGTDWRTDPINAETYLDLALAKIKGGSSFNTLAWAYANIADGAYSEHIIFHKTDENLSIAGVDMGNHGHNGANGSKGSPKQFAALGVPMNTGHTHSPSIYGRCYTAGVTASLEMGYNIGASSWAVAHIITYRNGQRQIIFA